MALKGALNRLIRGWAAPWKKRRESFPAFCFGAVMAYGCFISTVWRKYRRFLQLSHRWAPYLGQVTGYSMMGPSRITGNRLPASGKGVLAGEEGCPFIGRGPSSATMDFSYPSPLMPLLFRMARVTALELFLQRGVFRHGLLMAAHTGLFGLLVVDHEVIAVLALVLFVHAVVAALDGTADIDVAVRGLMVTECAVRLGVGAVGEDNLFLLVARIVHGYGLFDLRLLFGRGIGSQGRDAEASGGQRTENESFHGILQWGFRRSGFYPARPFGNTGYFARMRGMVTVKVLPSPLAEATSILPPCCMTTWRATYRPMPVQPLPFEEKKRVNSLAGGS